MSLIFLPEPLDRLKVRFQQSLNPIYTPDLIRAGHQKPNEQRKHVFDFEDGTRLCLSHEQLGQRLYLHCTGSMDRRCQIRTTNFANVCYVKLCELSGKTLKILQTDSDNLSVHLLCEPIAESIAVPGAGEHASGDLPSQRDPV
jgi:hypothetical protein